MFTSLHYVQPKGSTCDSQGGWQQHVGGTVAVGSSGRSLQMKCEWETPRVDNKRREKGN